MVDCVLGRRARLGSSSFTWRFNMPNSRSKIISPLRLLLALMPGHIHAEGLTFDPWTREDTYRQAALTGLVVMDWGQTLYVAKHTSTICFGSPNNCADYLSYDESGLAHNLIG